MAATYPSKGPFPPDSSVCDVLSGTLYPGYGDRFDPAKLEKRSPNTLVTEPSGVAHFAETREEGAMLYFVGIGPDRTDPVEK